MVVFIREHEFAIVNSEHIGPLHELAHAAGWRPEAPEVRGNSWLVTDQGALVWAAALEKMLPESARVGMTAAELTAFIDYLRAGGFWIKATGMLLVRDREALPLQYCLWAQIGELARRHGWIPAGTVAPSYASHETWSGTYADGLTQYMTDDDAVAMAEALGRALPDVPEEDVRPAWDWEERRHQAVSEDLEEFLALDPAAVLSGPNRDIVQAVEGFLRQGSVQIYDDVRGLPCRWRSLP